MQPVLSSKDWHFSFDVRGFSAGCVSRVSSSSRISSLICLGKFYNARWKPCQRNESDLALSISSDIYACSNKSVSHCTWSSVLFVENAREHKLITVNSLFRSHQFVRITSRTSCLIISKIVYQSDTSLMCSDGVCSFFSWKENFVFTG